MEKTTFFLFSLLISIISKKKLTVENVIGFRLCFQNSSLKMLSTHLIENVESLSVHFHIHPPNSKVSDYIPDNKYILSSPLAHLHHDVGVMVVLVEVIRLPQPTSSTAPTSPTLLKHLLLVALLLHVLVFVHLGDSLIDR